jgi:hypothetical protein
MKLTLDRTCTACPEQYNVFDETGKQIAYYRLRHGYFQVRVPNSGGELIYDACPRGDGIFDPDERDYYLKEAEKAVIFHYTNNERTVYIVYDGDKDIHGVFSSEEKAKEFIGNRHYLSYSTWRLDESSY